MLALISYFLELDEPGVLTARMGTLGSENRLTLVGKIHIAAIAAILAATIVVTVSRQLLERRWTAQTMRRLNVIAFAVTAVAFVVANVVLIALAIHNG